VEDYRDEVINVALHDPVWMRRDCHVGWQCFAEWDGVWKEDRWRYRVGVRAVEDCMIPTWA
jgi:hypothetical protein